MLHRCKIFCDDMAGKDGHIILFVGCSFNTYPFERTTVMRKRRPLIGAATGTITLTVTAVDNTAIKPVTVTVKTM
jgi:hypothetical protein